MVIGGRLTSNSIASHRTTTPCHENPNPPGTLIPKKRKLLLLPLPLLLYSSAGVVVCCDVPQAWARPHHRPRPFSAPRPFGSVCPFDTANGRSTAGRSYRSISEWVLDLACTAYLSNIPFELYALHSISIPVHFPNTKRSLGVH